eukprot:TRINITY_DN4897_c0_g1_i1.p1 TRINITY_DN4897_c0_g1~~TRINITY_DN4897_c0_g1_i1.p1  ORF type:complete len:413 (-),score=94.97 TRINITY_DN4897_c0_g1_i1:63-1301(-)
MENKPHSPSGNNQLIEFGRFPTFKGFDDILNFDIPLPQSPEKTDSKASNNSIPHVFERKRSNVPKLCSFCKKMIWSMVGKKHYFCVGCKISVHKKCMETISGLKCTPVFEEPKLKIPRMKSEDVVRQSSLFETMTDATAYNSFREFLETKGGGRFQEFWERCQEYKMQENPTKKTESAMSIYDTYIKRNSPKGVSSLFLDQTDVYQKIQSSIEKLQISDDIFDDVQVLAFMEMEKVYFPEYVKTEYQKTLRLTDWQGSESWQDAQSIEKKKREAEIINSNQPDKAKFESFLEENPELVESFAKEKAPTRKSFHRPTLPMDSTSFYLPLNRNSAGSLSEPNTPLTERKISESPQMKPTQEDEEVLHRYQSVIFDQDDTNDDKKKKLKILMLDATQREDYRQAAELLFKLKQLN